MQTSEFRKKNFYSTNINLPLSGTCINGKACPKSRFMLTAIIKKGF